MNSSGKFCTFRFPSLNILMSCIIFLIAPRSWFQSLQILAEIFSITRGFISVKFLARMNSRSSLAFLTERAPWELGSRRVLCCGLFRFPVKPMPANISARSFYFSWSSKRWTCIFLFLYSLLCFLMKCLIASCRMSSFGLAHRLKSRSLLFSGFSISLSNT